MTRTLAAAAAVVALVALSACARGDDNLYDTAVGATAGAMATPPAPYTPPVGATTGMTTGATTLPRDTLTKRPPN